jgi:4-hydroxy 2-oxovalerate aldolase
MADQRKSKILAPKILDCTVRDGGHTNGWNFTDEFVNEAYQKAILAGVDYFEIGYRFHETEPGWGKWARCEVLPAQDPRCKFSVMAHCTKSTPDDFTDPSYIVRVATPLEKLEKAFDFVQNLLEKGYVTFLNLMEAPKLNENHLTLLKNWDKKDVPLGLADSFGQMNPDDVERLYHQLRGAGFNKICFHAHNDNGLALENTLKAVELGFYCVDASQNGLGRGAGNIALENLLLNWNK